MDAASEYIGLFNEMDADGNGRLSKEEVRQAFTKHGLSVDSLIDQIWQTYDTDNDGEIDKYEFQRLGEVLFSGQSTADSKRSQAEEPPAERLGLFARMRARLEAESQYLDELSNSKTLRTGLKRRNSSDLLGVDWVHESNEKAKRDKLEEEKRKIELGEEYTGPTDVVFVAEVETVWEKRLENLRGSFFRSNSASKMKKVRKVFDTSDHPLLEKVRLHKEKLQDKYADMNEAYETSQHPMVWRMRSIADRTMGETEAGWALGQVLEEEPSWNEPDMISEMEDYMCPALVREYRAGRRAIFSVATEGQAQKIINAVITERTTKLEVWDEGILQLDVHTVTPQVVDGEIVFELRFTCQHRNIRTTPEGEIISGSIYGFQTVTYTWMLRFDRESKFFNYKIFEWQAQEQFSLI